MITPNWYFWTLGTSTSLCFLGGKLAKCNTLSGPVVLLSGIYPIKITYTYIHIYKCTHVHKGIFIQVIFITAKKKKQGNNLTFIRGTTVGTNNGKLTISHGKMMPQSSRKDTLCKTCEHPGEEPALCCVGETPEWVSGRTPGEAQPGGRGEGNPVDRTEPLSYS